MSKINEVIELNGKEGLEIDFSRIVFSNPTETIGLPSRPSWVQARLSNAEIVSNVETLSVNAGNVRFTEDDLQVYLKKWLEFHFNCAISSFRWMWDKFRDYKAA